MMEEPEQKSEWNIDDAILKTIYLLKVDFLNYIKDWNLEKAYWTLTAIDSEINPAMKEANQKILNEKIDNLETKRKTLTKEEEGIFYVLLMKTYKAMNQMMIESGWYFRRKELYMGL